MATDESEARPEGVDATAPATDPPPDPTARVEIIETSDEPTADATKKLRWRKRLVILLVVLTSFGVLTSTIAVWTHQVLLNTDRWVATVGPVAADPDVQEALSVGITNQLMQVIDAEGLLTEALPEKVSFLATPLSTAVQEFVQKAVLKLVESEQFQRAWIAVNTYGHQAVVNFLRGDSRVIQADNGVVTLNILPILARALQFVQEKVPKLLDGRTIPTLTYDMPVEQQNQELSQALGRTLKPEFGVFTLFQSDQLAAVQRGVEIFDRVVWVLVGITLALAVAAIAFSTRRWRTVMQLGGGIALAMALALAGIAAVKNLVLDLVTNPTNRKAVASTLREVVDSFDVVARLLLVFGIVVVVAAFLSGDSKWAHRFRQLMGRASGAAASSASTAVHRGREAPFPWLAAHRTALLAAGPIVAAVWLVLADVTIGLLVVILLLVAAYEGIMLLLSYEPSDHESPPTAATTDASA